MPNPDSTPVNALTFTSGFGSEADWLVAESDGEHYPYHLTSLYVLRFRQGQSAVLEPYSLR